MARKDATDWALDEARAMFGWARDRLRGERGRGPFRIVAYRGHGTERALTVRGRVLEGEPIPPASAEDSNFRNLVNTIRRIGSAEVPAAHVIARVGDVSADALTDEEGYFQLRIPAPAAVQGETWRPVELELADPPQDPRSRSLATARVLVPPPEARFGIISDIDDTVVKTDVANVLSMARLVLLTNAHTRLPFEGVAAFYRALHAGPEGANLNPVFYVSSSPWNLYDLLDEVFVVHGIPPGPLFLKDYGISRRLLLSVGHREHKLTAIREILDTHHHLPFVLIGDSGQKDPEIYRQAVREHPGRVLAIYIRDVAGEQRDAEVRAMAAELREEGVELVLVPDTVTAAKHAVGRGFIRPETLPEIRGAMEEEEAEPGPIESVVRER